MSKKKSRADLWKVMRKTHGDEGLYNGNSNMTTYSDVISSGSYALDDALGIWGYPKGRVVQLAGPEQSGKTLMSLLAIVEWQKQHPENWAFFIDAEYTFDKQWATSLGVDLDRIEIYRENRGTKIFDRLVGIPGKPDKNTGEVKKVKKGVLDLEIEYGGTGLGIIVLDSLAAIQPPAEEGSRAGKANIALLARFLPPELRKLTGLLTETGVLFIAINQIRYRPDVMYGNPESTTGGQNFKHVVSQTINFNMMGSKDSRIERNGIQVGHCVKAKVGKNKLAPPFRIAEFSIEYTKGIISRNTEVRDIGARYKVIERPNNKTWILDDVKYSGKDSIANALLNEELQLSVLERAKEAKKSFIEPVNNEPEDEEETVVEETGNETEMDKS